MTKERLIVYVDGFNLYHGIHDLARCRLLWLDLVALARSLRPHQELVKVRYFTAPVLNNAQAESRQATYINALDAQHGPLMATVQGRYQAHLVTCRACGTIYTRYEEKETDVNIAVNLVVDAGRREMDAALIISADSDLTPAIRAATLLNPRLFVTAAFPPKRSSMEMKTLMPASFSIGSAKIRQAQLPEVVRSGELEFRRPAKWR